MGPGRAQATEGTVAPARRRRRDRRADLLAAASHRFVESGIRATTMEDIASEAGAGKATLYRHFANKDAVIDALLEREIARLERRLDVAVSEAPSAAARIEAVFVTGIEFLVTHPVLTRDRDDEPAALLPRITADGGPLVRMGLGLLERLIAEGIATGELRPVDPKAAAEMIMRLVLSYFTLPPMHVRVDDPDQARALAHVLIAGGLREPARV